jgi:hypothetical protein
MDQTLLPLLVRGAAFRGYWFGPLSQLHFVVTLKAGPRHLNDADLHRLQRMSLFWHVAQIGCAPDVSLSPRPAISKIPAGQERPVNRVAQPLREACTSGKMARLEPSVLQIVTAERFSGQKSGILTALPVSSVGVVPVRLNN